MKKTKEYLDRFGGYFMCYLAGLMSGALLKWIVFESSR